MTQKEKLIKSQNEMMPKKVLSKLLHEGMIKASNTTGNISFNLADYLIKNDVIVLPCKVGDIVYGIFQGFLSEYTVISIDCHIDLVSFYAHFCLTNEQDYQGGCYLESFGNTVFLTYEEAKIALEKIKDTEC